jgi:transposase InsO family protein
MTQDIRSHHWTDTWLQDLMLSCMPITEDDQATVITTPMRTIVWTTMDGCMRRTCSNGEYTTFDTFAPDGYRRKKLHPFDRKDSPIRHYS